MLMERGLEMAAHTGTSPKVACRPTTGSPREQTVSWCLCRGGVRRGYSSASLAAAMTPSSTTFRRSMYTTLPNHNGTTRRPLASTPLSASTPARSQRPLPTLLASKSTSTGARISNPTYVPFPPPAPLDSPPKLTPHPHQTERTNPILRYLHPHNPLLHLAQSPHPTLLPPPELLHQRKCRPCPLPSQLVFYDGPMHFTGTSSVPPSST